MNYDNTLSRIKKFCEVRGWDPDKDSLAKSIVIESTELLEVFQWNDTLEKNFEAKKENVKEEIGDIFIYLVNFCNKINVDLLDCVNKKIDYNEIKFPESKFKNGHNEKFYRQRKAVYRIKPATNN